MEVFNLKFQKFITNSHVGDMNTIEDVNEQFVTL